MAELLPTSSSSDDEFDLSTPLFKRRAPSLSTGISPYDTTKNTAGSTAEHDNSAAASTAVLPEPKRPRIDVPSSASSSTAAVSSPSRCSASASSASTASTASTRVPPLDADGSDATAATTATAPPPAPAKAEATVKTNERSAKAESAAKAEKSAKAALALGGGGGGGGGGGAAAAVGGDSDGIIVIGHNARDFVWRQLLWFVAAPADDGAALQQRLRQQQPPTSSSLSPALAPFAARVCKASPGIPVAGGRLLEFAAASSVEERKLVHEVVQRMAGAAGAGAAERDEVANACRVPAVAADLLTFSTGSGDRRRVAAFLQLPPPLQEYV